MHVDIDNAHSLVGSREKKPQSAGKRLFLFTPDKVGLLYYSSFSGIYATIR